MSDNIFRPEFYVKNDKLTEQFIDEHIDKINWYYLTKHHKMSEKMLDKYADKLDWDLVWLRQNVSEDFIEKHKNRISTWDHICVKRQLSPEFVRRHINEWHWKVISQESILTEDFIREFKDYLDWQILTIHHYGEWNEEFIREMKDYIEWELVFNRHKPISNNLKREYAFKFNNKNQMKWFGYQLTDEDFDEWKSNMIEMVGEEDFKLSIQWNEVLSEDIIIKNKEWFHPKYVVAIRRNVSKKLKRAFGISK